MRLNVIKECGIGLVYVNEELNYSPFSPPPNESSVVLQEIHGEGSRHMFSSNVRTKQIMIIVFGICSFI
ncbi:unnamed protein product, partial [Vitis vinifera]|uniref:Uncharacterized protein n=1 Tax=Vitis vinifera TaxID=29760 RepID=D7TLI0_VITVI